MTRTARALRTPIVLDLDYRDQMTTNDLPGEWRLVGSDACAWFPTPSLTTGAVLLARIAERESPPDIEVRAEGVRVRIPVSGPRPNAEELGRLRYVSTVASELDLTADPSGVQSVRILVESTDAPAIVPFWQATCGYRPVSTTILADPLRRQPAVSFRRTRETRPLHQRIHVDSVRPAGAVHAARSAVDGEPFGVYGLALADVDGNVIDLVPGDPLPGGGATDWEVLFGAMAYYPVGSWRQGSAFVARATELAEEASTPILIDVRREGVVLDSGKDLWEGGDEGASFAGSAARLQTAARDLGLVAASSTLQFVQLGIDAVDVPAVRSFWAAALGYRLDDRAWVSDIYDPRRHDPVLIFQEMDPNDEARRQQRNRTIIELLVPHDVASTRVAAALAAGGRVLSRDDVRCTVADPEGNEITIIRSRAL